jgi:hypothetical protein
MRTKIDWMVHILEIKTNHRSEDMISKGKRVRRQIQIVIDGMNVQM